MSPGAATVRDPWLEMLGYYEWEEKSALCQTVEEKQELLHKTKEEAKRRYKEIARSVHPDMGGDEDDFKALQQAMDKIESLRVKYPVDVFDKAFSWVKR